MYTKLGQSQHADMDNQSKLMDFKFKYEVSLKNGEMNSFQATNLDEYKAKAKLPSYLK